MTDKQQLTASYINGKNSIIRLAELYPNDAELGEFIRQLYIKLVNETED